MLLVGLFLQGLGSRTTGLAIIATEVFSSSFVTKLDVPIFFVLFLKDCVFQHFTGYNSTVNYGSGYGSGMYGSNGGIGGGMYGGGLYGNSMYRGGYGGLYGSSGSYGGGMYNSGFGGSMGGYGMGMGMGGPYGGEDPNNPYGPPPSPPGFWISVLKVVGVQTDDEC